ncbi:MAG: FAD-dependent oxidoreductase [Evtepia sp.]|uniref:FAD-dependent oxidoreductase n=1 Tax=Evtepia sp. TaxID=2773933 RepID=UPI002A758BB0|nr:FAD-dependent oxidoreductase [Evtepia sp.]MDY3014058.1 FAD-dependent oxidoreductase [Evtepia sp.]
MINNVRERNPMPQQDISVRCSNFDEVALGYTPADAIREAMRCLKCRKKPCTAGCPIGQRIPEFIERVSEGDFEGAYEIINSKSCLPAVCGRVCPQENQCEKNCAQAVRGEAVGIGRLERFVADWHAAHSEVTAAPVEKKGKKVAVIGSGPAGIACAGDLAALGYDVTIFEKLSYAGGILTYGIPQFVLPNTVVEREVAELKARGVEIVTSSPIDKSKTVDDLFSAGYDAVFVGNGAAVPQTPRGLDTSLEGVWAANDYLTEINLNSETMPASIKNAKSVVVVGGGNVAVDAVRCARRLGAETTIVYRRTLEEAPARREEIHHTQEENIAIMELTNPVECYGKDGVLVGVKCEKMALGEPDESGRRRPVGTGEFFDLDCDNLVIATGTTYSEDVVGSTTGIDKDKWGGIATDDGCKTSRPGVFAGGDAVTGPATVVLAMGAGKRAAVSIDEYLSGK